MQKTMIILLGLTLFTSCGKESGSENGSLGALQEQNDQSISGDENFVVPDFAKYASGLKTIDYQKKFLSIDDLRYNHFVVSRNKSTTTKNYIQFNEGLRTIKLYGKKIILGKNQIQRFYHLIDRAQDIETLIIHAEEVEVYNEVIVPGANIEIRAKKLSFFGDGKFSTSPISKTELPAMFTDGAHGLNAGNIDLVVKSLIQDSEKVRFDLQGGDGQAAGPGQNGAPGAKPNIIKSPNYFMVRSEKCEFFDPPHIGADIRRKGWTCHWGSFKKGRRAGNGKPAKIGGIPGKPGNAGKITANIELSQSMMNLAAGKSGKVDTIKIGGMPGQPATTCGFDNGDQHPDRKHSCATAIKGKDINPNQVKLKIGQVGKVFRSEPKSWITDSFLKSHLKYTKEIFLSNNIFYTKKLLNELEGHLKNAKKSLVSSLVAIELEDIKSKIDMNLDFFGNKIGWVPNLAFEVNYDLFQKEVKRNIKLLYLAHVIQKDLQKGIINLERIKELQNEYLDKIDKRKVAITNMVSDQVLSSELLGELKTAQDEFEFELKLVETEIRKMAKENLEPKKKSFFDKAVKIFAAASKAIPIGQPALAAAGMGIEFIHNATNGSMSTGEILQDLPGVYDQFNKVDFGKSLKELNSSMDDMSPRHIPSLRTKAQKKEYFEKVKNFTTPIFKAVSAQIAMQKERKVSQSALDNEIERIKSGHPLFKKLSEKLNVLLFKKTQVTNKLEGLLVDMSKVQMKITQDTISMSYLFDDVEELVNSDAIGFSEQMDFIYATSLRRIEYYDYLLSKSFSYRFLGPAPVGDNLSVKLKRILNQVKDDSNLSEGLEKMWTVYNESLSDYVTSIVEKFEEDGSTESLSLDMVLTAGELKSLNSGKEIFINLVDRNIFGSNKEDLRIEDIEVINNVGFNSSAGSFDVTTTHLGKTILDKGKESYYFNLSNSKNHWIWTSNYNHLSGNIYSNEVSVADGTLLNSITGSHADIRKAFASPGARGFIKIKLDTYGQRNILLNNLMLRIDYTFRYKKNK